MKAEISRMEGVKVAMNRPVCFGKTQVHSEIVAEEICPVYRFDDYALLSLSWNIYERV